MSFFEELKRRNVIRVAVAYAVAAWLLVQVLEIATDAFEAPAWVLKIVMTLLAIGLIPALVFSWVYELTPEGIKRESDVAPQDAVTAHTAKRLDIAVIMLLIGAIGLFAYDRATRDQVPVSTTPTATKAAAETATSADAQASIAVLPFKDLSPEGNQGYFSEGIAEEILNALVTVDALKVASRTSSFQFKEQEAIGIPLIARELNVRHILEGSVRKAGDNVRITAQLIDAETDQHLWSETFDRTLTTENLFAIQDEIAEAIVAELGAQLNPGDTVQTISVKPDTDNLDAYELYLEANARFLARGPDNIRRSIRLFEQITEMDPAFARGWAGLAGVYSVAPSWGVTEQDYEALAVPAAEQAIALNQDLSMPYGVLGYLAYVGESRDWDRALEHLNLAITKDPKNATAHLWRGIALRVLGFFQRSEADIRECLAIDPAYRNCIRHLASIQAVAQRYDEARDTVQLLQIKGNRFWTFHFIELFMEEEQWPMLSVLVGGFVYYYLGPDHDWLVEPIFRALTDSSFDKTKSSEYIERRIGPELTEGGPLTLINGLHYAFGRYDQIVPYTVPYHWFRSLIEADGGRSQKRLIVELQLPKYWRTHGFPPQCHPVGNDDFECE